jgi:hypothetical protein
MIPTAERKRYEWPADLNLLITFTIRPADVNRAKVRGGGNRSMPVQIKIQSDMQRQL